MDRFWNRLIDQPNGCREWPTRRKAGYGHTSVDGKEWSTHRLAWFLTYGEIPPRAHVLHTCDNPPCCNPEHLFLGSPRHNHLDKIAKGRAVWGPSHVRQPLSDDTVRKIRADYANGRRVADLCVEHDRSKRVIYKLLHGETYADVPMGTET